MVHARELRVGNLVLDSGNKILRIDWFENDKVCMKVEVDGMQVHPMTEYLKYLQPIILTDEWLRRLGLVERYAKGEWSWSMNGKWQSYTEITKAREGYVYNRDYPNIKYVHQLQNLYSALTHEELSLIDVSNGK